MYSVYLETQIQVLDTHKTGFKRCVEWLTKQHWPLLVEWRKYMLTSRSCVYKNRSGEGSWKEGKFCHRRRCCRKYQKAISESRLNSTEKMSVPFLAMNVQQKHHLEAWSLMVHLWHWCSKHGVSISHTEYFSVSDCQHVAEVLKLHTFYLHVSWPCLLQTLKL